MGCWKFFLWFLFLFLKEENVRIRSKTNRDLYKERYRFAGTERMLTCGIRLTTIIV
jgi:hypothetical protein